MAAHFELHCNGAEPALFGVVVWRGATFPFPLTQRSFYPSGADMEFGVRNIGSQSPRQELDIVNDSEYDQVLSIDDVTTTGPDAGQFVVVDDGCSNVTLLPDESCTVAVVFAPTGSPGSQSAKLTIFDDLAPHTTSGRDIVLTGTAVRRRTERVPSSGGSGRRRTPLGASSASTSAQSESGSPSSASSESAPTNDASSSSAPEVGSPPPANPTGSSSGHGGTRKTTVRTQTVEPSIFPTLPFLRGTG